MSVLEFATYGEAIGDAASVVRANAVSAGLDAPVPTCPDWTVRDLVAHLGMVHRRVTLLLRGARPDADAAVLAEGLAAADPLEWFDDGLVGLLNALVAAPLDLAAPFPLADAPAPARLAWARRMAHETSVHGVDAMSARLRRAPTASELWMTAALAADGVDELLVGVVSRRSLGGAGAILVTATDAGRSWLLQRSSGPTLVTRDADSPADVRVEGRARELYAGLWNRGSEFAVSGEAGWADWWRETVAVRSR